MKAKVIKPFAGAPDGEAHPRDWLAGHVVEGELAAVAVREGWAASLEESAAEVAAEPPDAPKPARRRKA